MSKFNSDCMKIFNESYGDPVMPVEEGWGTLLNRFFNPTVTKGTIGNIIGVISNDRLSKFLKHPKMKKYLEGECNRLLKEEQKKDKSVIAKIPGDPISLIKRWWHNNDEVGFWSKPNFMQQHDDWIDDAIFDLKVGQFTTTFWYDTDHIDAAVVIFYSKDRDACLGRRIAAPAAKDLAEMFHEE